MKKRNKLISAILVGALTATLFSSVAQAGEDHIKVGGLFAQCAFADNSAVTCQEADTHARRNDFGES